ncbi:MAG: hypothetical protein NC200_07745 [Candidatus Gastranaerophilales bacterium]|nr:hypothetical protein [Candidatus Gastranaerophilales bacterium]
MYSVSGNVARIDGRQGIYDGKINNSSVRYGRNSLSNYQSYTSDLAKDTMPPLKFEYRYMPNGKLDKMALLGNAYEELGKRIEVKTEEMTETIQKVGGDKFSADALDINKDGYIDVAEYATSTLTEDILSSAKGFEIDSSKIDGVINNDGSNKTFALNLKSNEKKASEIYSKLYNELGLESAQEEFIKNTNNLVE